MTSYFWLVIAATMICTLLSPIYYALENSHYFSSLHILLRIPMPSKYYLLSTEVLYKMYSYERNWCLGLQTPYGIFKRKDRLQAARIKFYLNLAFNAPVLESGSKAEMERGSRLALPAKRPSSPDSFHQLCTQKLLFILRKRILTSLCSRFRGLNLLNGLIF